STRCPGRRWPTCWARCGPCSGGGTGGSAFPSRSGSRRAMTSGCPPPRAGTRPTSPSTCRASSATRGTSATSRTSWSARAGGRTGARCTPGPPATLPVLIRVSRTSSRCARPSTRSTGSATPTWTRYWAERGAFMTGSARRDYAHCMTRDGGKVPGARPPRRPEPVERQRSAGPVKPAPPARPAAPALASTHPRRPSLGGGAPAQGRELGRQGQRTVRKLLGAGLAEFDENGFQAVRVDDVVRRANISHGTFYLYFSNKDDLFKTLLRDALDDMQVITD